jgi:hypothetical protein
VIPLFNIILLIVEFTTSKVRVCDSTTDESLTMVNQSLVENGFAKWTEEAAAQDTNALSTEVS